ncbi:probable ubiquitin carboxyl-terminal hydrolase 5 isoform X1 [Plectropomus leopardus]|uniref:probable ubiquitin carboxyl-terminal hydrolase 5 isoform X1 n=1 Tax=Plectropomus leopardus TaxID=160734 RepID=UPI001C4B82DA|nr:probable ubiquitin carboxyl-terminal hydrolase 5 isoform X1 [Plectropomus leopardus]
MNHDLVQKFREKLDSFAISDYHGLISPGLTCYLNSVLQVLFMTEDFREAVKRCCIDDSTSIDRQLRRLFEDLQKSRAETHNFATKLGITNVYEQRDAAEYFEKILCLTSPEAAKIFKGELNHKIECLSCNDKNDSRSYFWILPLAVDDLPYQTYNVEKGLETFFKGEKVCGDNKMFCNRCNKKQDAEFGCEITQSPEVLTLLLKRFSFGYTHGRFIKLHCSADVPRTLHMKNCKYELYALVDHFGNLTGGHYTAHIRSFETYMWYHFNDDVVNKVKQPFGAGETSLRSRTAYLLMYRKVSVPHRYGGLSGGHTVTAGDEVRARLQALGSELQTHKAELDLTARADDVLAARLVVLHPLATGGTGPDGGTGTDALHLFEDGVPAVLEELEVVVDAAVVIAAVGAWSRTFPRLQTLPAELIRHWDTHRFIFTVFCGSQEGDVLLKVLHLFRGQHRQPAHLLSPVICQNNILKWHLPLSSTTESSTVTRIHKNSTEMGKIYQVIVHGVKGQKVTIDLCNTEEQMKSITVLQLREKIAEKLPETKGDGAVRLIFTDKSLDDDSKKLSEYGVQHMSLIMIVLKVPGGQSV